MPARRRDSPLLPSMASAIATSSSAAAATSSSRAICFWPSSYSPESQRGSFSTSSAFACLSATPSSRARRVIGDAPRDAPRDAPPSSAPPPRRELCPRLSWERSSLSLASLRRRVLILRLAATRPPTILVAMMSSMTTRLVTWTALVTVNHTATRCRNGATSSRLLGIASCTKSEIKFKTMVDRATPDTGATRPARSRDRCASRLGRLDRVARSARPRMWGSGGRGADSKFGFILPNSW